VFKNFLYFSRGQQIGILILLLLIMVVISINLLLPKLVPPTLPDNDSLFRAQLEAFAKSLENSPRTIYESPFEKKSYKSFEDKQPQTELFTFDPNTLDSTGFVRLGLKPYVAKNIVNYRLKGGKFKTPDDFSKIYGINPDYFEVLKPYIKITSIATPEVKQTTSQEPVYIDLNRCDTTELKMLRGIGSTRAKQIVNYRKRLGGFSSPEQLLELRNFPEELYTELQPYLSATTDSIKPILVNKATVEKLKNHPYINFYQAKAIYELRRSKEGLHSLDELKSLPEFTPEELNKLAPYLDFREIKYSYKRR